MAWLSLLLAGIFEVVWAFYMKQSDGFTKIVPSIITIIAMIVSIVFLSIAMKSIPLGTAYTIWTGIGAVGTFILALFLLGEPATTLRILAAGLIIAGLLLMKISA